jgi:hypothetical protein
MSAVPRFDSSTRLDAIECTQAGVGLAAMHHIQQQQALLVAGVDRLRDQRWVDRGGLRTALVTLGKCHRRHAHWFHFRYLELGGAEPPSAAVHHRLAPMPALPSQALRELLRAEWRLQRDLAWRCQDLDRRTRRLVRCQILPQLGEAIDDFIDRLRVASQRLEAQRSDEDRAAA